MAGAAGRLVGKRDRTRAAAKAAIKPRGRKTARGLRGLSKGNLLISELAHERLWHVQ